MWHSLSRPWISRRCIIINLDCAFLRISIWIQQQTHKWSLTKRNSIKNLSRMCVDLLPNPSKPQTAASSSQQFLWHGKVFFGFSHKSLNPLPCFDVAWKESFSIFSAKINLLLRIGSAPSTFQKRITRTEKSELRVPTRNARKMHCKWKEKKLKKHRVKLP